MRESFISYLTTTGGADPNYLNVSAEDWAKLKTKEALIDALHTKLLSDHKDMSKHSVCGQDAYYIGIDQVFDNFKRLELVVAFWSAQRPDSKPGVYRCKELYLDYLTPIKRLAALTESGLYTETEVEQIVALFELTTEVV